MKSEQEIYSAFRQLLKERLDIETDRIWPETTLESLGIDSLMQWELVMDLEQLLDVRMPDFEEKPQTVGEFVKLIQSQVP